MVEIKRTWETVFFIATAKDVSETVELTLNHHEKTYCIRSVSQDRLLSLEGQCIVSLKLKLDAIKAAVYYAKNNLK